MQISQQAFSHRTEGFEKWRLHKAIASEGKHPNTVPRRQLTNALTTRCGHQGVLIQAFLIQRPLHEWNAQLLRYRKLFFPVEPREGLNLSVHPITETALHESDLHHNPLAHQPPSTTRSVPVT